ncbi:hypothetical protein CJF30_00003086 [Rutstroemia sp. NJR-2017a BBW]|nr:hypothetical protein CJF30_00003086 [Rutstroemia sp. NJR-2017a BBW]
MQKAVKGSSLVCSVCHYQLSFYGKTTIANILNEKKQPRVARQIPAIEGIISKALISDAPISFLENCKGMCITARKPS